MPALSAADLAILNGYQYPGGVNAAAVINNIQAGSGTTTSYRHNGFMVYHRTFAGRVTFFILMTMLFQAQQSMPFYWV